MEQGAMVEALATVAVVQRACLDCGGLIPGSRTRCPTHQRTHEAQRIARRGSVYDRTHRKRAAEAIGEEPWCHWPGCFATGDLTGAHLVAGDGDAGYTVLCRKHNSIEANVRRGR